MWNFHNAQITGRHTVTYGPVLVDGWADKQHAHPRVSHLNPGALAAAAAAAAASLARSRCLPAFPLDTEVLHAHCSYTAVFAFCIVHVLNKIIS